MTLAEAVRDVDGLDEDALICVRRPWAPDAACMVVAPDPRLAVPKALADAGYAHFLEVAVAREVLEALGDRPVSSADRVRLLLHYAEHDAYPEWAFPEWRSDWPHLGPAPRLPPDCKIETDF